MKKIENKVMKLVKKCADMEITNTVNGKCLFLVFQPKVPTKLKKYN